ncbi:hypothetical protein [Pontibacter pamirensis]|uniref:hypothetical protein n=1 Tax=Pontibacter pamirensis TaxID=2562824 RepID=UPI0013894B27|nr:hypothetical protein [Pontibacter pamirensis]
MFRIELTLIRVLLIGKEVKRGGNVAGTASINIVAPGATNFCRSSSNVKPQ